MTCLDEEQLLAVASKRGPLGPAVVAHLGSCSECRRLVAVAHRGSTAMPVRGPQPNDLIAGRFVLTERLGAGAMGEVWAARSVDDGARVALKLPRRVKGSLLVQRALREARIAGTLEHPSIVRTFEVIEADMGTVLVMELLEGDTLQALLQREPRLAVGRACAIALGIAEALVHAHGQGVVHRDLKPSKVMLVGERRASVKLLDFGLARPETWSASEPRLTATGDVVGTVVTMSPEQVFGARDVDARTDVWALGVLAYRMLSGAYPNDASTVGELAKAFGSQKVRPIESCVKGLPLDLVAVVMQALEIDRHQRLLTAAAFVPVLRRHATTQG